MRGSTDYVAVATLNLRTNPGRSIVHHGGERIHLARLKQERSKRVHLDPYEVIVKVRIYYQYPSC